MSGAPAGPRRAVRVVARKWPDGPHWEHDAVLLGEDEHGTWVGAPAGTTMSRPGVAFRTDQHHVTLVPEAAPFVASFYARGGSAHCDVYVDITTVPTWASSPTGQTVTAFDLDLDVLRGWTGRVWVDDEDEFAAHRVTRGYPPDLVRLAVASCDDVLAAVRAGRPPYDRVTPAPWLEMVAEGPR